MSATPLKTPLTPENSARLLDLLCEDDQFRRNFQSDPSTALSASGLQPVSSVRCAPLNSLASKEAFQTVRTALQQQLTRSAMFSLPHYFEAGSVHTSVPIDAVA